jgi:hypothetical protein
MEVMTPAIRLAAGSAEFGRSIDTAEESLLWFEERELMILAASYWSRYRLSASVCRLSLFLLRENSDRPPDDCLDLSAEDIVEEGVLIGR